MKKYIQHNLPVLFLQIFFLALALIFSLSFSHKSHSGKLEESFTDDYLTSLEISEKEEVALMEKIIDKKSSATSYTIKVFDLQGELVFEETIKGKNLIENEQIHTYVQKSDFLMEVGNEKYFLLKE